MDENITTGMNTKRHEEEDKDGEQKNEREEHNKKQQDSEIDCKINNNSWIKPKIRKNCIIIIR